MEDKEDKVTDADTQGLRKRIGAAIFHNQIKGGGMKRNRYNIPKKVWDKWSKEAQDMFNSCYSWTYNNQTNASHPDMPKIKMVHWKTIAWNTAWIAANYRDNMQTVVK